MSPYLDVFTSYRHPPDFFILMSHMCGQVLGLDGLSLLSPPKGILAGGVALTRAWLSRLREAQGGRRLDLSSLGLDGGRRTQFASWTPLDVRSTLFSRC